MTTWRLEWLRLARTRRWLVVVAVFLFSGLATPIAIYYLPEILASELEGFRLPPPQPADAVGEFGGMVTGIGLLVVVVVAAAGVSLDASPPLAVFYRTRASVPAILLPRVVAPAAAASLSLTLGAAGAWYETTVLLGRPAFGALAFGVALSSLYLVFAVALAAFSSSLVRSPVSVVGLTVGFLLVLPVVAVYEPLGRWLPSKLGGSIAALAHGTPWHQFLGPAAVTAILIPCLLGAAISLLARREI